VCRAAAEEASAASVTAALACRGTSSFETNLAALEVCIALGSVVTARHALRGDLTHFLEADEPPALFAAAAAAAAGATPPRSLTPVAGPVLCGLALRALATAGAKAAAPCRDAVQKWRRYEGDTSVAEFAERLAMMFGAADEAIRTRVLERGTRDGGGGGGGGGDGEDGNVGEEEEAVAAAAHMVV
jgi:hypothetical protein